MVEIVVTLKLAPGPVGTYYRHLLRVKGKPKAQAAAARALVFSVLDGEAWNTVSFLLRAKRRVKATSLSLSMMNVEKELLVLAGAKAVRAVVTVAVRTAIRLRCA